MDKTMYIYLSIFVVLYGLYRLNSNEHFSDNTTVYIKTQQMRQYELAKEQLLKSQIKEIEIKRKMLEAQVEQEKLRNQKIEEQLVKRKEETDEYLMNKNKLIDEELKNKEEELKNKEEEIIRKNELLIKKKEETDEYLMSNNKLIEQDKISKSQSINKYEIKPYIERFNQIKKKVYEFFAPSVSIFNTAKTCGFTYELVSGTSPLSQGEMYMNSNKSKLTLHYADKTGYTGVNIPLSQSSIFMKDGVSKYQIVVSDFNSNSSKQGEFNVSINLSGIPDKFFNGTTTYIINECDDFNSQSFIMENQLWNSFLIFLALVVFALLVINYKAIIELFNSFFGKKVDNDNKIEGGNHIFYVGGYDYRDYSD